MSNSTPFPIVGSKYCAPNGLGFRLDRERFNFLESIFSVSDADKGEGKMNWKIKMDYPLIYEYNVKFTVHDNNNNIIMTLQESPITHNTRLIIHPRWKVYKGNSTDDKDFLFTVRRPRVFSKCDVEVYLPSTKEEDGGFDFEIVANWLNKDCVVKNKDGNILAEGYDGSGWFQGCSYTMCIRAGVDYAFIVALTFIFYEMSTGYATSSRLSD